LLLSTIAVFVVAIVAPFPSRTLCAVYVHPSPEQMSEITLQRLAKVGINTMLVDIYYPTGIGMGVFLAERKGPWVGKTSEPEFKSIFSLDLLIRRAKRLHISIHVTISCFGELPAIDPTNMVHRTHLRDVAEFILVYFPSVDGIHLDYVRYMNEWGLSAEGKTEPITTFVRHIREATTGVRLSAAVVASGDQGEYDDARYLTGQDCWEMSHYLDFICPMAYHLALGKKIEWVQSVSQFMSSVIVGRCRLCPTVQAYYAFQKDIVPSKQVPVGQSISGPTVEVPSIGDLRFHVSWRSPESRISIKIKDPNSREVADDRVLGHFSNLTSETYVLNPDMVGVWTTELTVHSLSGDGDVITVEVSDLNEELPGYDVLQNAILLATAHADVFCVYALNDLSSKELCAIRNAIVAKSGLYAYLEVVYVEGASVICGVEPYSAPFTSWYRPVVTRKEKLPVPPQLKVGPIDYYRHMEPYLWSDSPVVRF